MTEEKTSKFISLMNYSTFKYLFKNSKTKPFIEKVIFNLYHNNYYHIIFTTK